MSKKAPKRYIHFTNPPRLPESIPGAYQQEGVWLIPELGGPPWKIPEDHVTVAENGDLFVTGPCPWDPNSRGSAVFRKTQQKRYAYFTTPYRHRARVDAAYLEDSFWLIPELGGPPWRIPEERVTIDDKGGLIVTGPPPWRV